MTKKIIPTIFSHNLKEFNERFEKLIGITKDLQVDFMDGRFVSSKSVGLEEIPSLKKHRKNFEAHLMVLEPSKSIGQLFEKGFKKIIFHYESFKNTDKCLKFAEEIKYYGMDPFVAFNPTTSFENVLEVSEKLNKVLLMGVSPGRENQEINPLLYKKIRNLKKNIPGSIVQVDGGVNEKTAPLLAKSGADIINSGSFIAKSKNPKEALKKLQDSFL